MTDKKPPVGWCNKPIAGGGECSQRAGHDGPCR